MLSAFMTEVVLILSESLYAINLSPPTGDAIHGV